MTHKDISQGSRGLGTGFLAMLGFKKKKTGPEVVYEGHISGYQYHKGQELEHKFALGTRFLLKHEPENPFDDDAVAVYYGDQKIGFIPPNNNVEIAERIKRGDNLNARISKIHPEAEPWERVYLEVVKE